MGVVVGVGVGGVMGVSGVMGVVVGMGVGVGMGVDDVSAKTSEVDAAKSGILLIGR